MTSPKAFLQKLSYRQRIGLVTVLVSFLLFVILTLWSDHQIAGVSEQQAAKRWDQEGRAAQVSSFFVKDTKVDEFMIQSFEYRLENALKEAAIVKESENSRLYIDAYSAKGKITVVSSQSTLEADAIGIGGDFFFFHPMTLVSGSYFSGNDLMKDSVILDEEAAWQLFGSNDIEGMSVMIGGVPHYVSGVVKRQTGRFAQAAGLNKTVVYVSYDSLSQYGNSEGISTYELTAPNPVKGFVYQTVKEKFGLTEEEMVVVENSSRYSMEAMILVVLDFGIRSMQNAAVSYPYWENIARGYEDVRALVLIGQALLLLIAGSIIFSFLIIKWRNRTLTGRDIVLYLTEHRDHFLQKVREQKGRRSQ